MTPSGVLFDIDGVLVLSWRAIPGAAETVQQLADRRIACAYLTNTTTRTRRQIADALGAAGITVAADDVITAGALTAEYLRGSYPGGRCFLVNSGDISEDMPGIDLALSTDFGPDDRPDTPDVVVLGGAGPEFDHRTLSRVYEWMVDGVPVVAMHRSTTWATDNGIRIDTGMYLIGLEDASGRTAIAVGKPSAAGFLAAAGSIGVDPQRMVMIGDDLHNDVLAAQAVGMTGVLVRTGKFRQDTLDHWLTGADATRPDHVIDTVAELPQLLGL
ncbi:HAD-IIA family hydrolase [Mycobacterium decipiens]|uniref:HAD family hydrolase n=1 Tax=Mycobacterium decipiens TaxID=1430326 RepID=A0A1X2LNT3_9MYCO|nr:HAD-IIA family hydrolase [Mycobacterium decipiens]OSC36406.1 HAD family hydrolase [Mycobacterium decipiens]